MAALGSGYSWLLATLALAQVASGSAALRLKLNFDSGSCNGFWFWHGILARLLTLARLMALESMTNDDVRRIL